tara:strand:- start:10068 stop:10244 length:177 start_codon:yes stop_codon:yes gene_type:complete
MPERGETVTNIDLVNLTDRDFSERGKHVQLKWGEPTACCAIALERRFAAFKGIFCNVC